MAMDVDPFLVCGRQVGRQVEGAIGRAIVHDVEFPVLDGLFLDACDGIGEEVLAVENDRDHAETRRGLQRSDPDGS